MRFGLAGGPLRQDLPYADAIEAACVERDFSPPFLYAVGSVETIAVEVSGWLAQNYPGKTAATVISNDGGHGIFQETRSYPDDPPGVWQDPKTNALYAIDHWFLSDDVTLDGPGGVAFWQARLGPVIASGTTLVRCLGAAWNAGTRPAWAAHLGGNVDTCTENGNYAARLLSAYQALVTGNPPW